MPTPDMSSTVLFSIVESSAHPNFTALYQQLKIENVVLNSTRKAISQVKKQAPDYVVAEFFYGYGNNYAGINISNLDVFLFTLQKYAPETKVIVLVEKAERQYVDKLNEILPLHAVLQLPVNEKQIKQVLEN